MKSVFLDSFINRHFWLSYARIRVIFTASSKADDIVRLTRITAETYKPKFHCRRQSGMNFGIVICLKYYKRYKSMEERDTIHNAENQKLCKGKQSGGSL